MRIILTGGGSAGHVTPNIALLPYLKIHFNKIEYIGSKDGIEKDIIKKQNIKYHEITTCKLSRSFTLKNFLIPIKLVQGILEAKKILKSFKPNIIFSKGGYVALPVVIAAKFLKIPIVAHESDYSMGLANKLIYKYCNKMCFTFNNIPDKYKNKAIITGPPIRKDIISNEKINFNNTKKTLLIMGGSLGATSINQFIFNNISSLLTNYNIIHLVGKNKINKSLSDIPEYLQIEYSNNIGKLFNSADIIISRAGSNSIFEILALNKPMILIPLPTTASRGDQIENAKYFKNKQYAEVIYEENLTFKNFISTINNLKANKKQHQSNPFISNEKIVDIITKTLKTKN